jgi:hypothetical protein
MMADLRFHDGDTCMWQKVAERAYGTIEKLELEIGFLKEQNERTNELVISLSRALNEKGK